MAQTVKDGKPVLSMQVTLKLQGSRGGLQFLGDERLQYTGTHLTDPEGPASPYPRRGQSIQRDGGTGVKHPDTEVCMKEMSHLIPNVETKSP